MATRTKRKHPPRPAARATEILDVQGVAALLTVSTDTVYGLFQKGELVGRKVGRKWLTTKSAVLRWIENTAGDDTLARALESGNGDALAKALNTGKVRLLKGKGE